MQKFITCNVNTSLCDMASRYERLLRNPKGDLLVGVPTLTPIPTQKQRLTAKFVVKCNSTSTNELKVKWCPHAILCNDVDTVRIEGGVVDRHVGGVGIRGNSKYTNSQFLNDSVKSRLVAARLDVQAVGGQSNGTFYGGYGRDGRVVGTYSADDVTKLLNEKSSVAVPASGNEVHLMYRPSDEDEREEWVTDCRDGPLPNQTITSTDYPARGIVIWKGNGDAATTIEAGSGGTYYEAGTARSDLYFSGSSYSLYAGDGIKLLMSPVNMATQPDQWLTHPVTWTTTSTMVLDLFQFLRMPDLVVYCLIFVMTVYSSLARLWARCECWQMEDSVVAVP